MDAAKQLIDDTSPFVPRAHSAGAALQMSTNPFIAGAAGPRTARPVQQVFGELVRQLGLQTPVIVVAGKAGTGKTLLTDMTARSCSEMGLSVRRVDRGDQMDLVPCAKCDVLLVDQADSISDIVLQNLLTADGGIVAATMVFMCLPGSVGRFGVAETAPVTIELTPLTPSDARTYLKERGTSIGRPDLFTPEALDLVIEGSRGLPRLLRSIGHLAYFAAASEGASQIGRQHISGALDSRGGDGHNTNVAKAIVASVNGDSPKSPRAPDGIPPLRTTLVADPFPPPPAVLFEAPKPHTVTTLHPVFSLRANISATERTPEVSPIQVTELAAPKIAPAAKVAPDEDALSSLAGELLAKAATTPPALSPALNAPLKSADPKTVKEFRPSEERPANAWMPRAAGIAGALAAAIAIGVYVVPSMVTNSKPSALLRAATAPITIPRPVAEPEAKVETTALAKQTSNATKAQQAVPARKEAATADRVASKATAPTINTVKPTVTLPATQKTDPYALAKVATPEKATSVAAPSARETSAPEQTAAASPAPAAQEPNRVIASIEPPPSVTNSADQTGHANDPAAQAAAQKAAELKAAEERAAAERVKAAEQAFLLQQEVGRKAQAERDAALRSKEEKDAEDRARTARQNSNKTLANSLFGVGR